jgi:hypothetical protein
MTYRHCGLSFVLLTTVAGLLRAQDAVELDHAAGVVRVVRVRSGGRTDTLVVGSGATVAVRPGHPIELRVVGTNTALYDYGTETETERRSLLDPLRTFLAPIEPYLPSLLGAVLAHAKEMNGGVVTALPTRVDLSMPFEVQQTVTMASRVERDLVTIDEAVHGPQGLHRAMALSLATLERMRAGGPVELLATALRDSLGLAVDRCGARKGVVGWPVAGRLLDAATDLIPANRELEQSLLQSKAALGEERYADLRVTIERIGGSATEAAGDYRDLTDAAYETEAFAIHVASACTTWRGARIELGSNERRLVTFTVTTQSAVELSRVASLGSASARVTLVPDRLLQPSLGAAVLYAPGARYPRYGTRPVTGGEEIFRRGTEDDRFDWALTLGLAWRGLGANPLGRPKRALWLPEVMVNPTGHLRAFGVGVGASWSFVKVGTGVLWSRHTLLEGQQTGDVLPDKESLRTGDSYRSPRVYFNLSVVGVLPFD